jgi:3-mercaptopyruvate sulfurtransferase SseA
MFRAFGHDKVWVLDGGLPNWKANNYPVESDGSQVQSGQEAVSAVHKVYAGEKVSYVILFIQICFSRALPLLNLSYK